MRGATNRGVATFRTANGAPRSQIVGAGAKLTYVGLRRDCAMRNRIEYFIRGFY
jgi:hypothetical protein